MHHRYIDDDEDEIDDDEEEEEEDEEEFDVEGEDAGEDEKNGVPGKTTPLILSCLNITLRVGPSCRMADPVHTCRIAIPP